MLEFSPLATLSPKIGKNKIVKIFSYYSRSFEWEESIQTNPQIIDLTIKAISIEMTEKWQSGPVMKYFLPLLKIVLLIK